MSVEMDPKAEICIIYSVNYLNLFLEFCVHIDIFLNNSYLLKPVQGKSGHF